MDCSSHPGRGSQYCRSNGGALSKRSLLRLALASTAGLQLPNANALPAQTLTFPPDHGAHNDFRTEWWYITGSATVGTGTDERMLGFQVTFFRSRIASTQSMQSQFAAKQLIFAHAAVTDVQGNKLWHAEQIARAGFSIAEASDKDTDVRLRNWSLVRDTASGSYSASITAKDFSYQLQFIPSQPLLLQGKNGLSRKGPEEKQASYYYSLPQLKTTGSIALKNQKFTIKQGTAWLDHEWSQELLHPEAVGWDWIGMNLFDGSALTAFQLRRKDGSALWAGGSFRATSSSGLQTFIAAPGEVKFQALKSWKSPTTTATYPVEWLVRTPADYYTVKARIPNQELDSSSSTGTVYWEGLADLFDSNNRLVGRGYLEMTGYAGSLRL